MRICLISGCNNKYSAKGYCKKHYKRWWKYGDPLYTKRERHGMQNTAEYISWYCMKNRCYNKNYIGYHRYGGRGITICDRWMKSFTAFLKDMGQRPFLKAQIDRIDNNKGYYKENCRWATPAQNSQNGSLIKLSIEIARNIRRIYKTSGLSQKEIGLIYNMGQDSISLIVNNKQWKETKQPIVDGL